MKILKNICFLKEIAISLLFTAISVNVNAQTNLVKLDNFYGQGDFNELLVLSDLDIPITGDNCRKLFSELTIGSRGLWSRYYFKDVPKTNQWYKDYAMFKMTKPSDFYTSMVECLAFYDISNKRYLSFSNVVDSKQYIFMDDTHDIISDPSLFYLFYIWEKSGFQLRTFTLKSKDYQILCSKVYPDGKNYMELKYEDDKNINPLSVYKFTDTDFINEDIPDYNVNTAAKYLLLQRDYKLGQKYNTVIFPVDVPLYDKHHLYNNGLNKMIVYRLDAVDANSLNFVRDISGVLKANTPYIIKSESNDNTTPEQTISEYYLSETPVDHYDINCVKQVMEYDDVRVFAQYRRSVVQENTSIKPDEDIYVVSGNKLINCRNIAATTVNRFRWYIKRPRNASATPMTMVFDGVTEVESVEEETPDAGYVYDLSGVARTKLQNINSLRKGYYIVDGKVRLIGE